MSQRRSQHTERPRRVHSQEPRIYMPAMPPLALMDFLDYHWRLLWWRLQSKPVESDQDAQSKPVR